MQTAVTAPLSDSRSPGRFLALALLGLIAIVGGFLAFRAPRNTTAISPELLAEKYGLRVHLVAVTAAGGLVDLRLKIIDAEKAGLLLQAQENFPVLYVAEGHATLQLPREAQPDLKLEDDGNLYVMYPNARNAVKPGTPVTVRFGSLSLEQIPAQ